MSKNRTVTNAIHVSAQENKDEKEITNAARMLKNGKATVYWAEF